MNSERSNPVPAGEQIKEATVKPSEPVIVGAARTAIGKFGGSLGGVPAPELGAVAVKGALARAGLAPSEADEVIMGNVIGAGLGQNPARQAAVRAGVPFESGAFTVNKVCGSGLKAVILAAQSVAAGDTDISVAGGMENMSLSPYLLEKARAGYKMGHGQLIDSMIKDGLWDAYNDCHMGIAAENIAEKYSIGREKQDNFALDSNRKAVSAIDAGRFAAEIEPVILNRGKGGIVQFETDERPFRNTSMEKLASLEPAFRKGGTITAGNSSGISDGAAALVVTTRKKALERGLRILASIKGYATSGLPPGMVMESPVPAVRKLLGRTGLDIGDVGLVELNEAFAAQSLAVMGELGIDPSRVNVKGGSIALGHPIGASGARILVTLLYSMAEAGARYGLATLCMGGGNGLAVVLENEAA